MLYIKGKISRRLGTLYKAKKFLNKNALLTLYYSFIYPYINYCISVWGNTKRSYLNPLVKIQKKSVRFLWNKKIFTSTSSLFKNLKILTINEIYIYSIQLFNYKFMNRILPAIFDAFYIQNCEVHTYNTRQRDHLHTPLSSSDWKSRTVRISGVKINNHFTKYIRNDCSYASYKRNVKEYIINNDMSFLMT